MSRGDFPKFHQASSALNQTNNNKNTWNSPHTTQTSLNKVASSQGLDMAQMYTKHGSERILQTRANSCNLLSHWLALKL